MAGRRRDREKGAGLRTEPLGGSSADLGRLRRDMAADRERLRRHVEDLREALVHWGPGTPARAYVAFAASAVQGWYSALEDALGRAQSELESGVAPRQGREILFHAMLDVPGVRPAILPRHLEPGLLALLNFRQAFRHTPPQEIAPARLEAEARRLTHLEHTVHRALEDFDRFLARCLTEIRPAGAAVAASAAVGTGHGRRPGERDGRWRSVERPRTAPRYRRRLPVRFAVSGEGWRKARTADVSNQGLCVVSDARETPGGWLDLQVELPDGQTVELEGRVVWARPAPEQARGRYASPGGFGLHLVRPPDTWTEWLEHVATER